MKKDESARGWVIVASCFWLGFLNDGIQFSFGLLFVEFLSEFQQSKATTAAIGSLFLGWLMLGPVVGKLTAKYGCRLVVLAGASLTFIGLVASVFSTSVYFLYGSYGCFGGLGFLLLFFPRRLMIISYFERRRSLAMGISTCGSGLGTIAFNPLTKWLIDVYGWRGTLLIEAGLMLNCVACGLVMRPFVAHSDNTSKDDTNTENVASMRPPATHNEQPSIELPNVEDDSNTDDDNLKVDFQETERDNEHHDDTEKDKGETSRRQDIFMFHLLKRPKMIVILIFKLLEGLTVYTPVTFLPDMTLHKGWSRAQATWLLTLIGIVNTACRIPIGRIADLKCVNRMLALGAAFILMGIMSMIMSFTINYKVMIAECALFAVFIAGSTVLCSLAIADLFNEGELTYVFGMVCCVHGVGSLVSGPVSGALFDATGDYTLTFVCAWATTIAFLNLRTLVSLLCVLANKVYPDQTAPEELSDLGALFDATGDYTLTFVCAGATTILAGIMCVGLFCTTRQTQRGDAQRQ